MVRLRRSPHPATAREATAPPSRIAEPAEPVVIDPPAIGPDGSAVSPEAHGDPLVGRAERVAGDLAEHCVGAGAEVMGGRFDQQRAVGAQRHAGPPPAPWPRDRSPSRSRSRRGCRRPSWSRPAPWSALSQPNSSAPRAKHCTKRAARPGDALDGIDRRLVLQAKRDRVHVRAPRRVRPWRSRSRRTRRLPPARARSPAC